MRIASRAMAVLVLALLGSVLPAVTPTFTGAVALAATAALIMGGSGLGNPTVITDLGLDVPIPNYIRNVENYYIAPNSTCKPATCRLVPVVTPEGLLPPIIGNITFDPSVAQGVADLNTALQNHLAKHPGEKVVIFGYSQSGDIITKTLRNFANHPTTAPSKNQVSFVVIGNTNRPNGGILARFPGVYVPILNITFDGAKPTDTGYKTTDIAFEYDSVADFPQYPIDVLADVNSIVGFLDVHATYPNPYLPLPAGIPFFPTALPDGYTPTELKQAMQDPNNRQTYGDTTYITIPAINLPILQPLLDIGGDTGTTWLVKPIVDLIQPSLRVLIDLGYNRAIPYGEPTPAGLFPNIDPFTLSANLAAAVSKGVHDALADIGAANTGPLVSTNPPVPQTPLPDSPLSQSAGVSPAAVTKNSAAAAGAGSADQPNATTSKVPSLTSGSSVPTKPGKPLAPTSMAVVVAVAAPRTAADRHAVDTAAGPVAGAAFPAVVVGSRGVAPAERPVVDWNHRPA